MAKHALCGTIVGAVHGQVQRGARAVTPLEGSPKLGRTGAGPDADAGSEVDREHAVRR